MGPSRRRRYFGDYHGEIFLRALKACRDACIEASRQAPPSAEIYKRTGRLMAAIDDCAEVLTGNREHFWLEQHTNNFAPPESSE